MDRREFHRIGCPGAGKTRLLAEKAAAAVDKLGRESVVIVSLTKAAAVEIAGRVDIPRENVGTLHSLCMHAAGLEGKTVLDSSKGFKTWNEWVASRRPEFKLSGGSDPDDPMSGSKEPTRGTLALERFMLARHRLTPHELWTPEVQEFGYLWAECLKEQDATDFTEMIEAGLDLETPPGNPSVLLADEVQDFSRLEGAVVRKWAEVVDTCILVGDEDQSIYGWRGADPHIFSAHPVPEGHSKIMGVSHRVPIAVHALARRIIGHVRTRTDNPYLPTAEEGKVTIREDCTWRRPEGWVDDVLRDSERGGVMVLASCAFLLAPLLTLLKEQGIPFHNPLRRKRGDWNPLGNQDSEKRTASRQLLAYLAGDEEGWPLEELQAWVPLLGAARHKVPLMDDDAYLRYGVRAGLQRATDAPGGRLSKKAYLDLFQDPDVALGALSRSEGWLRDGLSAESKERLRFPLAVFRRGGVDLLRATPKITVGTIHSVKGGEARHVYVITALPRQWSDSGGDELHRLFYVGVTRARESCTMICGDRSGYEF